jgi:hypothetical protein
MTTWTLTYSRTHATFAAADADRQALLTTLARAGDPSEEYRVQVHRRGVDRFEVVARRRPSSVSPRTASGPKPKPHRLTVDEKLARAAQTSINLARHYAALHAHTK